MSIKQFSSKIVVLKNANKVMMVQYELIIVGMEQHSPIAIGLNANQLDISTHFLEYLSPTLSSSRTAWERMESIQIQLAHFVFKVTQEIGMFRSNIASSPIINQDLERKM
jgi:hypothetical protein